MRSRLARSSVAKYGLASLLPRLVAVLTTVLISPLAISRIGVQGFGYWVLATQIPSIVVSADFGLTQALINELSLMQRQRGNLRDAHSRLIHLSRLLWVVACTWLCVGLVAGFVYSMFAGNKAGSFTLFAAVAVALLIYTAGIPALVWSRAQLAQERGHESVLWEGLGKVCALVLSVGVLLVAPNPLLLVVAFMLPGTLAVWANAKWFARREFAGAAPIERETLRETYRANSSLLRKGRLFVLMQVAYLVGTALDPYLVGGVLGASDVVYVNIAGRPFAFLPLFVMLFVPALWPVFARIHAQDNRERLRSVVVRTALGGAASVCLGALIIILARDPIFRFLSAGQLQPSMIDLLSIALLAAASVVASVMSTLLNAIDGVRIQAMLLLAGASVSLLFKVGALAWGGVTAYLATSAVTYVVLTTVPLCVLSAKLIDRRAGKDSST